MTASASNEYVTVAAETPYNARVGSAAILGSPIASAKCPQLSRAVELVVRMILSGIPPEDAAKTVEFPTHDAKMIAELFRIGLDDTGVLFAQIRDAFKNGCSRAEIERKFGVFANVVRDALYFYQLEKPPGKGSDPAWRREVIKLCVDGCAIEKIAARYGCTAAEVRAGILYEGGLLSAIPGISIAKQRACVALYPQYSSEKIATMLQISPPAVRAILKRSGVERIGPSGFAKLRYRADAFLGNDPATLYWLGFVFAEGHAQTKYKFAIALARNDMGQLYRFCEYLGTNNYPRIGEHEIKKKYPGRRYKNCRVDVCNSKVIGNLLRRGFRTGKRYHTMNDVVIEIFVRSSRYFLLGYFDGNGGISLAGRKQVNIRTPLPCVRDAYTEWLNKNAPGATTWKHEFHCWTLQLTGRRAQALINFMYFDDNGVPCELALPRKVEQAKQFRDYKFREPQFGTDEIADIMARRARHETYASIARHYCCSPSLICNIAKGRGYNKVTAELRRLTPLPTAAR